MIFINIFFRYSILLTDKERFIIFTISKSNKLFYELQKTF
jgi:hypothetical protein